MNVQRIAAAIAAAYPATSLDTLEIRDYGSSIRVAIGIEHLGAQYRCERLIDKRDVLMDRRDDDSIVDTIVAEMFCNLFAAAAGPPAVPREVVAVADSVVDAAGVRWFYFPDLSQARLALQADMVRFK